MSEEKMKWGVKLLQPLKLLSLILWAGVLLSGCKGAGAQDQLYRRVQEVAAQSGEASGFDVALSTLTAFDWDEAVVFKHPVTGREIEEAIGVKYQGPLDLTYGIFFVKDRDIVYEELFPKDFETRPKFMIYPHSGGNVGDGPHFEVFTPDSIFTCSIAESDQSTACYTLKPVELSGEGPV